MLHFFPALVLAANLGHGVWHLYDRSQPDPRFSLSCAPLESIPSRSPNVRKIIDPLPIGNLLCSLGLTFSREGHRLEEGAASIRAMVMEVDSKGAVDLSRNLINRLNGEARVALNPLSPCVSMVVMSQDLGFRFYFWFQSLPPQFVDLVASALRTEINKAGSQLLGDIRVEELSK